MTHQRLTPAGARAAVYDRQAGVCYACGTGMHPGDMDAHHRLRRRDARMAGGEWCPCLIVGLHSSCHNPGPSSVHGDPERARGLGLIVPSWADPRVVPVWLQAPWPHGILLGCDGSASWYADGVAPADPTV